ncbi:MAG: hypothetical protein H5T85_06335, partial [Actinobacteria bacterium]|nr:hypothetical protein [Actinomycetota bacterium]
MSTGKMYLRSDIKIESVIPDKLDLDMSTYRNRVRSKERYNYRVVYKYSDLLISSDRDICKNIRDPLKEIYEQLEFCIEKNPLFLKSLSPVEVKSYFPPIVKKMCQKASIFRVGPMATVAGAVCEYLAHALSGYCKRLIIENGGDVYIKADRDVTIDVFLKNKCFRDRVKLL